MRALITRLFRRAPEQVYPYRVELYRGRRFFRTFDTNSPLVNGQEVAESIARDYGMGFTVRVWDAARPTGQPLGTARGTLSTTY